MKIFKFLAMLTVSVLLFTGCEDEEITNYAFQDVSAPVDIAAAFDVSQDDTGTVTITPSGEGVQVFKVDLGNGETAELAAGESVTTVYAEGEYMVKIVGVGSTGLTSEYNQLLNISFKAPENLVINVDQPDSNPKLITVSATADNATVFDVYFGDVDDEEPTQLMLGASVSHTYAPGVFEITVIARGAGAATVEEDAIVIIPEATDPLKLPITFDEGTVNYAAEVFGGTSYEVVVNPDLSGANDTESNVAAVTNAGVNWEGLVYTLGEPVDFSGASKTIKMKVWSDVALPVLMKFEGGINDERQTEVVADHGGTGWEELSFDFSTDAVKSFIDGDPENGQSFVPTGQYSGLVIFIDGPGTAAGTFYLDDIQKESLDLPSLPVTFENSDISYQWSGFGGADFGPIPAAVIDNPDASGINTSSKVLEVIKVEGAQVWAGASMDLDGAEDFAEGTSVSMKVWSPRAGTPILLKMEVSSSTPDANGNPTVFVEVVQNTSVANAWEELTFDLTSYDGFDPANGYDRVIVFPDFNNPGLGESFYFDDIAFPGDSGGGTGSTTTSFPVDLESPANGGASANWSVFENVDNPALEIIANPDMTGNTSATVAKFTARQDGNPWAGTITQLTTPFTLDASNSIVKIWVWKSKISDVGIKFENATQGSTGEIKVANTKTNEWEELTFDFSGVIGDPNNTNITGLVIFPDFEDRSTESVSYFDNITLNSSTGGSGGGSTDTAPTSSAPTPSEAASDVFSIFSDAYTNPSGVNYYPDWGQQTAYDMVSIGGGSAIKYTNINYQGIVIGENVDATGYDFVHIDMWSGDYTSLPFYLISGSGEESVSLNLTPNTWNSIDIPLSEFTSQGLSIGDVKEFKFDVQPDNGGTIYIDNLYFYSTGGDTSGGTGSTGGTNTGAGEAPLSPIDFETGGYGADWTWSVFENESNPPLEIVANPDPSGINTSSTVAKFTALQAGQPYAGVESKRNEDIGDFTFEASNSIVKIMVYKTEISDVGLKFSEANGEAQPEVKVANTKINEWEELTFDLSGSIGQGVTGVITQIIIFPDFQSRSSDNVVYFDNITFGSN